MGNIVSGVEFVIKTWTFFILMGPIYILFYLFIYLFCEFLVLAKFLHGSLC